MPKLTPLFPRPASGHAPADHYADHYDDQYMAYFPLSVAVAGKPIIICGGGVEAVAKVRLLLKTKAHLHVFADDFAPELMRWAHQAKLTLHKGMPHRQDIQSALFGYIAYEGEQDISHLKSMFDKAGKFVCVVDNKQASSFITPALIDRAPVTIAITSEGFAPVFVRQLKSRIEQLLPSSTGRLIRLAGALRPLAQTLPQGYKRRQFWHEIFTKAGPHILSSVAKSNQYDRLAQKAHALIQHLTAPPPAPHIVPVNPQQEPAQTPAQTLPETPHIHFVSAGPGDACHLTLAAHQLLHEGDVIIHDRLISDSVLELCRREARFISVGKTGFDTHSTRQSDINHMLIDEAKKGGMVIRLKGGDASIFARLDEEIAALDAENISFSILPGVTAASAMAADMGVSLTRRAGRSEGRGAGGREEGGRGAVRRVNFITGYQLGGYAEHDWRALSRSDAVTAIYMGKQAANYIQGRLLMFGADRTMPVTVGWNIASPHARWLSTHLGEVGADINSVEHGSEGREVQGPAVILLGLAAHPHSKASQLAEAVLRPTSMTAQDMLL